MLLKFNENVKLLVYYNKHVWDLFSLDVFVAAIIVVVECANFSAFCPVSCHNPWRDASWPTFTMSPWSALYNPSCKISLKHAICRQKFKKIFWWLRRRALADHQKMTHRSSVCCVISLVDHLKAFYCLPCNVDMWCCCSTVLNVAAWYVSADILVSCVIEQFVGVCFECGGCHLMWNVTELGADVNGTWSLAGCIGQCCPCCRQETFCVGSIIHAYVKCPVCNILL